MSEADETLLHTKSFSMVACQRAQVAGQGSAVYVSRGVVRTLSQGQMLCIDNLSALSDSVLLSST